MAIGRTRGLKLHERGTFNRQVTLDWPMVADWNETVPIRTRLIAALVRYGVELERDCEAFDENDPALQESHLRVQQ